MPDHRSPDTGQDDDDKALYEELLPAAMRKAYRAAGADLDLGPEIRLMRAFLTMLFRQPARNQVAINQATSVLARMIYIQHRSAGQVSDLAHQLGGRHRPEDPDRPRLHRDRWHGRWLRRRLLPVRLHHHRP